jgi:Tol biopolymer transport system component
MMQSPRYTLGGSLALLAAVFLFGQTGDEPKPFAAEVLSASVGSGVTFSPDGNTIYFSRDRSDILVSRLQDGTWAAPVVADFSGRYRDGDPFLSPDGLQLFFWSSRPLDGQQRKGLAIWVAEKVGGGWGTPRDVGVSINGPDGGVGFPAAASNGTLYFMADREDSIGGLDIYRAKRTGGQYAEPENLGPVVNSRYSELDAYVAPDESYIVFSSDRPGGVGAGDLYVSQRKEGVWTPPQNLGPRINSTGFECCPSVAPDGKHFYFTSQGLGANGIYEAGIEALGLGNDELTEDPKLFAEGTISTPGAMSITFSPDGRTLWFAEASASIMASHLDNGKWSTPEALSFSGRYFDFSPCLSSDGSQLVFSSSRPRAGEKLSLGIWAADKTATGWGSPKDLGALINGSGEGAGSPSLAANGTLYFVTQRPDSVGGLDIYRAKRIGGQYSPPENLGPVINSPARENDVYVGRDESYIIFSSDRPGGLGENDLYLSEWKDGAWMQPRNLGPAINSARAECCPSVSPDGKYFFFKRPVGGKAGIYRIGIQALGLEQK